MNCGSDSFILEITAGIVSLGACRITRLNLASFWNKTIINFRSKWSHVVYNRILCADERYGSNSTIVDLLFWTDKCLT